MTKQFIHNGEKYIVNIRHSKLLKSRINITVTNSTTNEVLKLWKLGLTLRQAIRYFTNLHKEHYQRIAREKKELRERFEASVKWYEEYHGQDNPKPKRGMMGVICERIIEVQP